ncbi:MAG: DUF421 domain-containing protein [Erysipelotrichia bacterium]|nr:DUF421 domain-containing protein [Erysipelotrichia bacterium]NCC55140.1 DUF421 domain-containing protein [Erysipelotrichia bacterium]
MFSYVNLVLRCVMFYFILIIALRLMGKREVGELSVFDIVIYLVMSELLALALTEIEESIFKSLIPIMTLALLQVVLSFCLLKSERLRDIVDGKPVILIHNGTLNQAAMKKQRYNLDDLLSQLRDKDISCISEVQFAILENSGNLSILRKQDCVVLHPTPLIQDRKVNKRVLKDLHKDDAWLKQQLQANGYVDASQIFLCMVLVDGLYILEKK